MLAGLIALTLLIVILILVVPLRTTTPANPPPNPAPEEAKLAGYRQLADAELDWQTGKLSDEDYHRTRTQLRAEAVELMVDHDQLPK